VGPLLGADHGNLLRGAGVERGSRVEAQAVMNPVARAVASRFELDRQGRRELDGFAELADSLDDDVLGWLYRRTLELLAEPGAARLTAAQAELAETSLLARGIVQLKGSELQRFHRGMVGRPVPRC